MAKIGLEKYKYLTYEEMGKKVAEEALDGYIYQGKTLREWIDLLAQTQWIPCSERLPEENDVYLVAVNSLGCPTRDVDGFMAHTDRKWEVYGNKVIAWMPLPKPYQPEITIGAESEG